MLLKILFTLIIVLVVAIIFRTKNSKPQKKIDDSDSTISSKISPHTILYTLLALIISISALIFFIVWSNQHQIINIRVIDSQGQITNYQAHRKTIEGRKFVTLDGVSIVLGESDRIEMIDQE